MNVWWLPGWKKSVEKTQSPHLSYFVEIFKFFADTPLSEHVWGWVVKATWWLMIRNTTEAFSYKMFRK